MPRSDKEVLNSLSLPQSKALQAVTLAAAISGCTDDVHNQATMRVLGVEASATHSKVSGASTSGVHELCPDFDASGNMFYTTVDSGFSTFTPMYLATDGSSAEVNVDGLSDYDLACLRFNADGTATGFDPISEEAYVVTPGSNWTSGGGSVELLYDDGYGINGPVAVDEDSSSVVAYPNYVSATKCSDIVNVEGDNIVSNEVVSGSPCEYDPEYDSASKSWVFSVASSVTPSVANSGDTYLQDSDGNVSLLVEGMRTPHIHDGTLYGAELNDDGDLDIVEYPLETEEVVDTAASGSDTGDTAPEPDTDSDTAEPTDTATGDSGEDTAVETADCSDVAHFTSGETYRAGEQVCGEFGDGEVIAGDVSIEGQTVVLDEGGDAYSWNDVMTVSTVPYDGNSYQSSEGSIITSLTLGILDSAMEGAAPPPDAQKMATLIIEKGPVVVTYADGTRSDPLQAGTHVFINGVLQDPDTGEPADTGGQNDTDDTGVETTDTGSVDTPKETGHEDTDEVLPQQTAGGCSCSSQPEGYSGDGWHFAGALVATGIALSRRRK